ncbi:MAG: DUF1501 domain-containing protein [Planctomycetaceae bacterium]|nr:DUF1501 domain-containing protein [Planctomycetaceae bacterium]
MPPSADHLPRREILRIGALSVLGAAVRGTGCPSPLQAGDAPGASPAVGDAGNASRRPAKCIFILLQGGPSHLDLWDLKPEAPAEIRGPFQSIDTTVPGLRLGELLPLTAQVANHLAVVRSVEHRFANHIAGTYITLTGSEDQPDQDREAHADDFPGPGAVLNYLERQPTRVPASVSLPTWLSIPGPSNRMPGQYGGFLGGVRDPFLISGEPQQADFKPLSLSLPDGFGLERMQSRWSLLGELERATRRLEDQSIVTHDRLSQSAYELLIDPRVREALDLSREPQPARERYGMTKIGQSLLLARRLVEAGVQFVAYNAFNQEWDTHGGLIGRYRELIPGLDRAYSALVGDLAERGMLDETLVVNTGEFGRTPLINKDAGRDHWPHAYSTVLAGGGVRGGQVYGASDPRGAYVASQAVSPADLLATMWHQMGIDPQTELRDRLNRPMPLSRGRVVHELLG